MSEFPKYYKSIDGKIHYKILSHKLMEELQQVGNRFFYYKIEAKQYPEMLLIKDVLDSKREDIVEIKDANAAEALFLQHHDS